MKSMKYKGVKPHMVVRLPELEINIAIRKIVNWVSHIRHLYWLAGITAFLALLLALMPYNIGIKIWLGIKSQGTLVSLILIFGLVAVSLVWSTCQNIDVWIFKHFNMRGWRAPWLDWMMLGVTQIGSGAFGMAIAFIILLKGNHILAYQLAFGTLTLWLVVELLKILIRRTRPYIKLDKIRIIGPRARGYSFPSGHTSQSFFIAALIVNYYHTGIWISLCLFGIALLVGITRIYVGMHYPRDVLGGTILGSMWGTIGVIVNNYIWSVAR